MADQLSSHGPVRNPTHLSLPWLIALIVGMCIVIALLQATAEEVGRNLGGEVGVGLGLGIVFIVVCPLCWIVTRQFANPNLSIICGVFVGLGLGKMGEEVGRNFGGGNWGRFGELLMVIVGYFVWMSVMMPAIANRQK